MTGSIGVDIQRSRAAVCLTEWANGRARQGPVGDGSRILVPVASTAASWGSPAAETILGALPACGRLASMLYAWRQDPWSAQFLTGLHRRLLDFLGQAQPEGFRGHRVFVCADPEITADWATASELLDQVGLPGTEPVRPADALVCRWLSETPTPPSGTVLAVACGETATIIGSYSVTGRGALLVGTDGQTRVEGGCGPWVIEMARDALGHCRPGVPARAVLGLLDGVDEFAAMVRASRDDTWVEWAGPLSQYMFEPLRASRPELARRATVTDYTRPSPVPCTPHSSRRASTSPCWSGAPAPPGRSSPTRSPGSGRSGRAATRRWTSPTEHAGGTSISAVSGAWAPWIRVGPRGRSRRLRPGRTA